MTFREFIGDPHPRVQQALHPLGVLGGLFNHGYNLNHQKYSGHHGIEGEIIQNTLRGVSGHEDPQEPRNIAFSAEDKDFANKMLQDGEIDKFRELREFYLVIIVVQEGGLSRRWRIAKKIKELVNQSAMKTKINEEQFKEWRMSGGANQEGGPQVYYAVKIAKRSWNLG